MVVQAILHPAKRRRLAAKMPPESPHDVVLRPLGGEAEGLIATASDQNFIPAVLADLKADDWRQRLAARRQLRRGTDGRAELSQPVHRKFNLVLLEAVCSIPGFPRVDPEKLAGMGIVLRRRVASRWQGWMSEGTARRGWLDLGPTADLDPDLQPPGAEDRPRALAAMDRLLAERRGERQFAEKVFPLFVAPPDICEARGRTILYALLPLASAETTEATETLDYASLPDAEAAVLRQHFSSYLKQRPRMSMPRAGQTLDPKWRPLDEPVDLDQAENSETGRLFAFARFLQQLSVEFGLSEDLESSAEIRRQLSRLSLVMERDHRDRVVRTMAADEFIAAATPVLLAGEANGTGLTMPLEWPRITAGRAAGLQSAAIAGLSARFAQVAPQTPKFDRDQDLYGVRAFVRVRGHDNCPPKLVWSPYSAPFRIRPWWDSDAPPSRISLPDVGQLRDVKPGISFEMPPAIANLLQKNMKKLKDGEGSTSGFELGWLCSFSIPIITLCAFIVLNIFLSLFNLIFQWLLWIKICIPYPRPK